MGGRSVRTLAFDPIDPLAVDHENLPVIRCRNCSARCGHGERPGTGRRPRRRCHEAVLRLLPQLEILDAVGYLQIVIRADRALIETVSCRHISEPGHRSVGLGGRWIWRKYIGSRRYLCRHVAGETGRFWVIYGAVEPAEIAQMLRGPQVGIDPAL